MSDTVVVSLVTSTAAVLVALISAWSNSNRAVTKAVSEAVALKDKEITDLKADRDKTIEHKDNTIAEQGLHIQRLVEKRTERSGDSDDG